MKEFKLDDNAKITSGFTTPEGYFDAFTEKLMEKLPVQEDVKVIPLYRRKPVWLSAAASFALLLGLGIFFTVNAPAPQPDDTAIENYLVYEANVNSYDLLQGLDQQDLAEMEESIPVSDEAIEDYLKDENPYLYE